MWSSSNMDLKNLGVILDHEKKGKNHGFEPAPYAFTKLENGKKIAVDSTSMTPPSWLLLDHTLAVIWLMFDMTTTLQQLSIDDLKWAHEFLRGVRNRKGDNPPDVKVCLKEIQDRLINLYAQLTSLKKDNRTGSERRQKSTFRVKTVGYNHFEAVAGNSANKTNSRNRVSEDFDEIAAAFGEKIMEDSTSSHMKSCTLSKSIMSHHCESKADGYSLTGSLSPSRTTLKGDHASLLRRHSSKDLSLTSSKKRGSAKHKNSSANYSKKTTPILEKEAHLFEEPETTEDEEVEKYILSIFEDEKNEEALGTRPSTKSFIPTKRKNPATLAFSEMISTENSCNDSTQLKKEKTSKKVHCVAEMRSLKFQKSMKVQDMSVSEGGEEAAYSNLKAEIRRLTINPDVSKNEIMKFLKEWRSEQVDRLHNELKRLNSIEEFMKNLNKDGLEPNLPKELSSVKSNNSFHKI